ncbi:hypothetical protein [Paractinoplanes globisporus]|uniref:Uncharacterized protein n=1 Tax=Paractinoplanes globisporus TaxID=113565 RepID=A0ABW6WFZ1_9ACTN|nr:hypothetical protein [Actinoplanes globisporus]
MRAVLLGAGPHGDRQMTPAWTAALAVEVYSKVCESEKRLRSTLPVAAAERAFARIWR